MADEPVTSVSLEEPGEYVGPGQTSTPAPETPAPDAEPEPEGVVFNTNGEKLVPLKALREERGKRKESEKALSAKDEEINALKPKALRYDEAAQYLEQAKPIIERIRQQGVAPQQAAPVVDPAIEAEAVEYAKDFDLFTPEGKPDTARAMRILKRNDERAGRLAKEAVAPLQQHTAEQQSKALYHQYVNAPEVNGIKIDPEVLAQVWRTVPAHIAAQPNVAEVLYNTALGIQVRAGKGTKAPLAPVVTTESLGSGGAQPESFTHVDDKFLQASGMSKKAFTETRDRYKPGVTNSLE